MDDYLANLLEKLKNSKDAKTYIEIGDCYCFGRHTTKNEQNAMYYYQEAANMGSARGECKVGTLYYYGAGVRQDNRRASKYFKSAADKGDLDAMYLLGEMYWEGAIGWGKGKAFELWMKAAKQHHPKSQLRLGDCYITGVGEDIDYAKATYWYACAYIRKEKYASSKAKDQLNQLISYKKVTAAYVQNMIARVRAEHPEYING